MESIHKVVVLGASNSKRHYPTWVDYLETNSEIINLASIAAYSADVIDYEK